MGIAISRICFAAALSILAVAKPASADDLTSVSTGGVGTLTMCSYRGCNLYHHIKLPPHITIGDKVHLRFGSNIKRYNFPVVRIVRDRSTCTVFSQLDKTENVEKIDLTSCRSAPAAR